MPRIAEKIPFSVSELQKDFFTRGMRKYMPKALGNPKKFQEQFGTQYYDWEIKGDFMYQNSEHAGFLMKTLGENIMSDEYTDRIIEEKDRIVLRMDELNEKVKSSDAEIGLFNKWCNTHSKVLPYMSLVVIIPELTSGMSKNLVETTLKPKGIKDYESLANDVLLSAITITDEPSETVKMSNALDKVLTSKDSQDFDKEVDEFLIRYGYRRDRDLSKKSFWETREDFLKYVENIEYSGREDVMKENEKKKQDAMEFMERNFKDKGEMAMFKKLTETSYKFQRDRENLNHSLIKSYFYARPFILKIGQRLHENNVMSDTREIFNLTQSQINKKWVDIHE